MKENPAQKVKSLQQKQSKLELQMNSIRKELVKIIEFPQNTTGDPQKIIDESYDGDSDDVDYDDNKKPDIKPVPDMIIIDEEDIYPQCNKQPQLQIIQCFKCKGYGHRAHSNVEKNKDVPDVATTI